MMGYGPETDNGPGEPAGCGILAVVLVALVLGAVFGWQLSQRRIISGPTDIVAITLGGDRT